MLNKEWFIAAGKRALRTFAQTLLAGIGVGQVAFGEVQWVYILSVAGVALVVSLLTSIAGLPELSDGTLVIDPSSETKDIYKMEFNEPLENLVNKKSVTFIIKK